MSADRVVVFLGPSLAVDEARGTLAARYLSPVRCGDVLRVRARRPRAVAIVDGLFDSTAAVWHKEILLALEDGIAVFGAGSMGALRAAELAPFGMVGVGKIFEAYRDGIYTDDDEVAVLHGGAAEGYRALSEPMANIRATVAAAVEAGVIRAESGERLLRAAKETFYQERSLASAVDRTWDVGAGAAEATRFRGFIAGGGYVDQKRLDALALVHHLSGWRPAPGRRPGAMQVNRSSFVAKLHRDVMCRPFAAGQGDLSAEERVGLEARLLGSTYLLLRTLAELLSLADGVARALRLAVTPRAAARVFEHGDFGLGPAAKTRSWARAHDLDDAARKRLVERLAAIDTLLETSGGQERRRGGGPAGWKAYLLALLRIDGRYPRWRPAGLGAGTRAGRAVLRHVEAHGGEEFRLYRRIAKLWRVVDEVARRQGFDPVADVQVRSDDFRRARGLRSAAATRSWLRANDLDLRGYTGLVAAEARLSGLRQGSGSYTLGLMETLDPVCWLLDAIRLTGLYPGLRQRLERGPASPDSVRPARGDGFAGMLRRHCARLGEPVPADVEAYARALDFPDGQTGLSLALAALEARLRVSGRRASCGARRPS
ncbi:MAG TPA: TfuA-like protein [Methylomirabilota bacterium]